MVSIPDTPAILGSALLGKAHTVAIVKDYYMVFGILTIIGGIIGFVKAKSTASIIAGSISGFILILSSLVLPERPILGGVIALCVSVLLAGKFVPDFVHKRAFMPGGLMALLSLAGIALTILALLPK